MLFEELLKKQRQKIWRFVKTACACRACDKTSDVARQVFTECRADVLLVDARGQARLAWHEEMGGKVVPVSEYGSCPVETERRRWAERLPPVDQMSTGSFDDLIERSTRYTHWLRLFDKQIGKGKNLRHFRRGIEKILRLWLGAAHFPRKELQAEIFTVADDSGDAAGAYKKVEGNLVEPLRTELGLRIELHFKKDDKHICHARHLQTQSVAISFDRGFDFVNEDGTLRRNFVKIDGGCMEHLQEYRKLPEYKPGA
jgi:hypothetical protein